MFLFGGLINLIASSLGTTPPGLRLILTLFAGYLIVAFYRSYVADELAKLVHHLYFLICGMAIYSMNFGRDIYHPVLAISVSYMLIIFLRFTPELLVASNFIFHMLYLFIGYIVTSTESYDICWTLPHCILTLRLIGLSFDVADGLKDDTKLSKEQMETAINEPPSIFEIFAFGFFPITLLVGPQFSFNRYKRFINGDFNLFAGAMRIGIQRFVGGLIYMAIYLIGSYLLPNSYLQSNDFRNEKLPIRLILLGTWGKIGLCKYVSCWLLVEGALICLEFTYDGQLQNGAANWYGCSNIHVFEYETGLTMHHYISSFNVNTNRWVACYVYKRLKHFENRAMSHLASLIFLAFWHGAHSGYYVTFILEFLIIIAERQISEYYNSVVLAKFGHILIDSNPVWEYCRFIILKSYDIILMGFCMIPFTFLTFEKWTRVFGAVYYFGFIFLILWFAFYRFHKVQSTRHAQQSTDLQ